MPEKQSYPTSQFTFLGYHVRRVVLDIPEALDGPVGKLNIRINVAPKYAEAVTRQAEVAVEVTVSNTAGKLSLTAVVVGRFKAPDDTDLVQFHALCERNAPAVLYPFVRALIATFTAQAGVPTILLPTVNFARKPLKKQAE
jgi:preprotein translocase subunit SecB